MWCAQNGYGTPGDRRKDHELYHLQKTGWYFYNRFSSPGWDTTLGQNTIFCPKINFLKTSIFVQFSPKCNLCANLKKPSISFCPKKMSFVPVCFMFIYTSPICHKLFCITYRRKIRSDSSSHLVHFLLNFLPWSPIQSFGIPKRHSRSFRTRWYANCTVAEIVAPAAPEEK